MKSTINSLVLIFGLLLLSNAHAETTREQLKQMVEQLQQSPNDNALREKIIALAATVKPAPTIPDAAIEFEGRAQAAYRSARSRTDIVLAIQEYGKAIAIAPWIVGYYLDLCTIYEKSGVNLEAQRNCKLALVGEQDAAERVVLKRRIAGLGLLAEKTSDRNLRPSNPIYNPPYLMGIDMENWPIGTRYYCGAWSPNDGPYARREYWMVYDGTALTGVALGWISSEDQIKQFEYLDIFDFSTTSFRRDNSRERTYDEKNNPGIQMGWVMEISSDQSTINRSNAYGRQESCKRQAR